MIPLRSVLYVPAARPHMLARARELPGDLLLADLEDGVAPGEKGAARENLLAEAGTRGLAGAGRTWGVRVNAAGSPWIDDDLALVRRLAPPVVVLPKAEDPHLVATLVAAAGAESHGLMIETATGVAAVRALAALDPRPALLILGSADLQRSLGARPDPERRWESHAMQELLLAARAFGCQAIDGVWFHFRDHDGLREHARVARGFGYDGKSCIHPAQLEIVHEVFASTPQEVAWARSVLCGWEEQDGASRGVVVVAGEMIEALHVDLARRILARGERGPDRGTETV